MEWIGSRPTIGLLAAARLLLPFSITTCAAMKTACRQSPLLPLVLWTFRAGYDGWFRGAICDLELARGGCLSSSWVACIIIRNIKRWCLAVVSLPTFAQFVDVYFSWSAALGRYRPSPDPPKWLDRLPTKSRMIGWGLDVNPCCIFCRGGIEDRNHLFGLCSFMWRIGWSKYKGPQKHEAWDQNLNWFVIRESNAFQLSCMKLFCRAFIFHIRKERNERIHEGLALNEELIVKNIAFDISVNCTKLRRLESLDNL